MRNLSRILFSTLVLLVVAATAFSIVIKDRPTASSSGSDIVIRWTTVDETGVQKFEILRRAGMAGDFMVIGTVDQLRGNNSSYEFLDKSVFKTSGGIYQYKVRIVNGQSPAPETEIVSVSHVSSAAKRTWGSIKAMFR
jgi:hypothetical protein